MDILGSVGDGGTNDRQDVQYVQSLLNIFRTERGGEQLELDGRTGPKTNTAIRELSLIHI